MYKINSYSVLESTLQMHGAEKYLPIFKKYGIDSKTLGLLNEEDLIAIGVDDADVQKKLVKQIKNLPKNNEILLNVDDEYTLGILKDIEQHLKLIQACISVCLVREDINISDIKLTKSVEVFQNSINIFTKDFNSFKNKIVPNQNNKRKTKKWKYVVPLIITTSASFYAFKKFFFS